MDSKEVWSKASEQAKSAWRRSATVGVNGLDALGPVFAPVATRWDQEAERRTTLRTQEHLNELMRAQREWNSARSQASSARAQRSLARRTTRNPLSSARRSAATADKAARKQREDARGALDAARQNYPPTLLTVAAKAHSLHVVPAGFASWLMSSASDWATWPATASAGLIGLNAASLWLGRRAATVQLPEGLTAEERQLMERLAPAYWTQQGEDRGLAGTVTTPADLTSAGIECHIRLDGRWTVAGLSGAEQHIRALLGARTSLPLAVTSGPRGGWAVLTLRTRSAADDMDQTWTPGASWGVDMTTGEGVEIPLGERLLIAGRSGAGKSVATRPLLYRASEGDTDRLVIIDLKQIEGRNWDHRARIANTPEATVQVAAELSAELTERLAEVPKGEETIAITPQRPRITVFVDEGAEVIGRAKDALDDLESLARMGRAGEIHLVWATQKPSMSGSSPGIPPQIAAQMSASIGLAVKSPTDARVVFGEDAQTAGWDAHDLPAPGVALLRDNKRKPNPIRVRQTTPGQVVALPDREIWERNDSEEQAADRPALRLVKDNPAAVPEPRTQEAHKPAEGTDAKVLEAVQAATEPLRQKAIVEASGLPKGTVSKAVKRLVEAGQLTRTDDGAITPSAGEVSA